MYIFQIYNFHMRYGKIYEMETIIFLHVCRFIFKFRKTFKISTEIVF